MEINVNWLAVGLATLSSMVVGSIWYARSVFGNKWIALAKLDTKKMEQGAMTPIIIAIAASFVTAFVLAHFATLAHASFNNSFLQDALTTAFWAWFGFTAARFITHDAFEGRPAALTVMNIAHEFVTFMVMALIIGLLPPVL
jgi:hypothetical protein